MNRWALKPPMKCGSSSTGSVFGKLRWLRVAAELCSAWTAEGGCPYTTTVTAWTAECGCPYTTTVTARTAKGGCPYTTTVRQTKGQSCNLLTFGLLLRLSLCNTRLDHL